MTAPKASGVSMDVLSLLRLTVRRWRVTAPAVLLTVLALVAAVQVSSPTYQATGSVVLLAPPDPPVVNTPGQSPPTTAPGQNPFARYGDLAVMADILTRTMTSESRQAAFEQEQVTDYEVVANRLQRGPVVEVTGRGPTPDAAVESAEVVLAEAAVVLEELQRAEGADPGYYIRSAPLEPASDATARYGSTVRAAIAVLAVGVLITVGLAVLAEAVARRRRVPPRSRRRATARQKARKAPAPGRAASAATGPKGRKRARSHASRPSPADNGRSGVGAERRP